MEPTRLSTEQLIAAVLADPAALWAVRHADVRVAGPWTRQAKMSERISDVDDCDYGEHGPHVVARVEYVAVARSGYRCERGCEKPGKGDYCCRCGGPLLHEPGAKAWRVTMLPDDIEAKLGRSAYRPPPMFTSDEREAAEAWCDARLREAGVLLVEEGP